MGEEFRKQLEETIKVAKEQEAENKYIDDLLAAAAKETKIDVPEAMIHEEAHRMVHQFADHIAMQGINIDQFYKLTNSTEEDLKDQIPDISPVYQTLFINGFPLVTMELKNQYTGQDVNNAVKQYKNDRSSSEPIFKFNVGKTMKNIRIGNKGQLSLEYVLSSMIVLLIISIISVPILLTAMDYSTDIIDSINSKSELSKITGAIDFCYASGKGSKRIVFVDFNQNVDIRFYNDGKRGFASINLNLSDNEKEISSSFDYNGLNENIHLSKGFNKIAVKWDEDSNVIELNRLI